jgi:hypothetical protein
MNRDLSPAGWRKSSHSGGEENCVEVAGNRPGAVAVRDSKDASGPVLKFGRGPWHAFTDKIKNES